MLKQRIILSVALGVVVVTMLAGACAPAGTRKELSFTPLTYTNEQYGFSIQYPDNYKEDKSKEKGTMVFNAVGPLANNRIPVLTINILDAAKAEEQGIELMKAQSGSDINVTFVEDVVLADGGTKGRRSTISWYNNDAKFDMRGLSVGVLKGDKMINVTITSIFAMYNPDRYMEILNTFTLKQ
jgi:hypothetical protein